ncbi:MAG: NAD(P)/FAD-dependent oxidoreductase [Bacteroidetes bacterium]|nr:NAD(P)/FAD-dependent oxidoreductase [Bacteroidota bacterium]MBU1718682.1 NAD(P)/FAD-dependent oxidoreductase [Bacteroidota bacterium]
MKQTKRLVILGAGTAGTMMANKLRKELDRDEWEITIVDQVKTHYYQPGFLFIPFGIYKKEDVIKPKSDFLPIGVNVIFSEIDKIVPDENKVLLTEGSRVLKYDFLIVATGAKTAPEETEGLAGELWYKDIFDFYTIVGAVALADYFKTWKGGKLVINVTEIPYKCPVAPLEFAFLADAFFTNRGMRDKVDITLVTPLSGAFTKPKATKLLSSLLEEKNINIIPDYNIARVDNKEKKIYDYADQEVAFDCLVTVPTNMGDAMVARSGMGDDLNFIPTDKHTLRAENHENIFVIGDAANIPTSKAGSVAHFAGEILTENLMCAIEGRPFTASFDGHANCYIVTGNGMGTLIDFNYDTEPLPGTFPLPGVGPFGLLKVTRMNHYGKMIFRWMYWHILLKGKEMPISSQMSMAGKKL